MLSKGDSAWAHIALGKQGDSEFMTLTADVKAFFSQQGDLQQAVEGFAVRDAQVEMAQKIAQAILDDIDLVVEAGTGTGKTFAYLVPALLSNKKIIISTATKNLQQQLVDKDLPLLSKLTAFNGRYMLFKGRENYLCAQRLELAETQTSNSRDDWKKLAVIRAWRDNTKTGDLAECVDLDEQEPLLRKVCARLEFCQVAGCGKESDCFYPQIKQAATDAQVLVVNHHLFCADLALREQGFGELLPQADVYIFDEAHQLADIAAQFLGFSISRHQLEEWVRDVKQAKEQESPESQEVINQLDLFVEQIKLVNDALGKWEKRWTWEGLSQSALFMQAIQRTLNHLALLGEQLKALENRGKLIAAVAKRAQDFEQQLRLWIETEKDTEVRWAESSQARFKLNLTPLSVADPFKRQRNQLGGAWVFTSATLTVGTQFDFFLQRLGLYDAQTAIWPSPFNYAEQGYIYHPVGLPEPADERYITICLRAAWPLLKASQGRAFFLFTSFRALNEARAVLEKHWPGELLVQGEAPKHVLLERFKQAKSGLLLGTSSFWEGVDVRGQALQLVLIDRIPFIPPDDPLVQAREAYLKQKGLSAFAHFQLPQAIMALKQGCGRLIRDPQDRGVLILCDPRLTSKAYGRGIVKSLPDFPWIYEPEAAIDLLKQGVT